MSIEKKIADSLMGLFGKAKSVETAVVAEAKKVENIVVTEFKKIETAIAGEEKNLFDKTREAALAANADVNKLKADLQDALTKAANLHQAAVDAANAARAAAEADVERFKALAAAHAADLATQSSQIVAPVVAEVKEEVASVVEPTMAQQFAAAQSDSTPAQ